MGRRRGRGRGPVCGAATGGLAHLDDYRYLHATRADLLRRLMRTDDARAAYLRALHLTDDLAERRFLQRRLRELESRPS